MASEEPNQKSTGKADEYKRKYEIITERCRLWKKSNEQLANALNLVNETLIRQQKNRKIIEGRLDAHGDKWREALEEFHSAKRARILSLLTSSSGTTREKRWTKEQIARKVKRAKVDKAAPGTSVQAVTASTSSAGSSVDGDQKVNERKTI